LAAALDAAAFFAECLEFHAHVHTKFVARPDLRVIMAAPALVSLVLPFSRRPQRPSPRIHSAVANPSSRAS